MQKQHADERRDPQPARRPREQQDDRHHLEDDEHPLRQHQQIRIRQEAVADHRSAPDDRRGEHRGAHPLPTAEAELPPCRERVGQDEHDLDHPQRPPREALHRDAGPRGEREHQQRDHDRQAVVVDLGVGERPQQPHPVGHEGHSRGGARRPAGEHPHRADDDQHPHRQHRRGRRGRQVQDAGQEHRPVELDRGIRVHRGPAVLGHHREGDDHRDDPGEHVDPFDRHGIEPVAVPTRSPPFPETGPGGVGARVGRDRRCRHRAHDPLRAVQVCTTREKSDTGWPSMRFRPNLRNRSSTRGSEGWARFQAAASPAIWASVSLPDESF